MRAAVVLLSGGLDSAVTLAEALAAGFQAHALTVRYGQRHALEVERAGEIARALGAASHRVVAVDLAFPGGSALTDPAIPVPKGRESAAIGAGIPATYVPARNTVLLALALSLAETLGARDLFLGVNAVDYSGYPDCRPAFLSAFEALAAEATRAGAEGARFTVHAPLLQSSKGDIVRRGLALGVDLSRTLSCYDPGPDGEPCRACDACLLRARGFAEAGIPDPALALLPRRGAG
ncbi:MAG TPA: 7-cyano-7-deazaguanine synthase QueC [Candidatus Polarisedimenticolaceae bacterium]|nr:7-cyano-7-deazaguanine synthase QueC [Candidatus Polarisedimenticolaceae bacterium]